MANVATYFHDVCWWRPTSGTIALSLVTLLHALVELFFELTHFSTSDAWDDVTLIIACIVLFCFHYSSKIKFFCLWIIVSSNTMHPERRRALPFDFTIQIEEGKCATDKIKSRNGAYCQLRVWKISGWWRRKIAVAEVSGFSRKSMSHKNKKTSHYSSAITWAITRLTNWLTNRTSFTLQLERFFSERG